MFENIKACLGDIGRQDGSSAVELCNIALQISHDESLIENTENTHCTLM